MFLVYGDVQAGARVDLVADYGDFGRFHYALHKQHAGDQQTDFDSDGQVEQHGQRESEQKHRHVRARIAEQRPERPPAAHVVRHDDQYAGQTGHRDVLRQRHQEQQDQQQHDRVDDSGYRRPSPVVDVGHRAGDRSRCGNTAEQRRHQIGRSLRDQFGIRVVAVACYAVGYGGRQQRLDGAQHGDRHGYRKQVLDRFPVQFGHGGARQARSDREAVTDRVDAFDAAVPLQKVDADGHDDDGDQRSRYFLREFRTQRDNQHAQHADGGVPPVDRAEVAEIEQPLADEVARNLLASEVQTEHVGDLRREDRHGDAAREADDDGVGDELDDGSEPEDAHQHEQHAGHQRGDDQARLAVLLDDAVYDDDECARRPSDLYAASSQQRDDQSGEDGRDDALLGRYARGDAERDSQRQRDDADDDAGHQVGSERAFRIVFQTVEQFGSELQKFHDAFESIFRDSSVKRLQKYAKNRKMRTVSHVPRVYSFFVRAGGARLIAGRDGAGRSRAANVFSCGLWTVG